MPSSRILPEKITHPLQLMAAWFVMLILLTSVFLTAACKIEQPSWAAGFLTVSAVLLAFSVVMCVFLMLTRFRPHLQDGPEYAAWIRDERRYKNHRVGGLRISRIRPSDADEREPISPKPAAPLDTDLPDISKRISALEMRADKVRTTIEVANCIDAIDLVEHLNTLGFSARVYREGDPEKDTQDSHAIWVGSLISPVIAIQVIKEAVEIWPFLEYLHLSQDSAGPEYIDHEIFIGGSTSTAEGYGLRPWTPDEIQGFPDEMPLEQFHALVRSKYPPEALKVRSPRRKELVEMKKRRPRSSRGVAQSE